MRTQNIHYKIVQLRWAASSFLGSKWYVNYTIHPLAVNHSLSQDPQRHIISSAHHACSWKSALVPLQKYVKRSCQKVHCSCISSRSAAFTLHSLHSWPDFLLCTSWLTDFSSSILLALFLTTRRLNSFLNSVEKSSFFNFHLLSLKWSYRWPSDAA